MATRVIYTSPAFQHMIGVAVLGVALACTVCARKMGRKFDMSAADALVPGVSTLQDAVAVPGPPTAGYLALSGKEVAQWSYLKDWPRGAESANLMIQFDGGDRIIAVIRREQRKAEGANAKPETFSPL